MSDFLGTTSAREWVDDAVHRHTNRIFGKVASGVVWSDTRDENGSLLVHLDPAELVAGINSAPYILLDGHDPGKPVGQVLEAKLFVSEKGTQFVVAIFGYYAGGDVLQFEKLGFDTKASVPPPQRLPELPDEARIQLAIDPREVDAEWLDQLTVNAEVRIESGTLSHNSADATQELIRVGLPYVVLVWNPFITAIATEAGKATYAAFHRWWRSLLAALAARRNPVLDIQAHQDGCQVSFHFRGKDVGKHFAAHDTLPSAATSAAQLIRNLKKRGMPALQLIYEFDHEGLVWYPSYAILNNGRIITHSAELIAIDKLPTGLSLGFTNGNLISPLTELTDEFEK